VNPPLLSRRALLGAAAAAPMAMAGAPPPWAGTLMARAASLNGAGLLRSYTAQGDSPFDRTHADCAYVYDNAAAGLALLAAGDRAGACRIADALAGAQSRDRFWHDGRLRNAYRAGPVPASGTYPLNGWWDARAGAWREDAYQAGTATGPLAWAILLWAQLGDAYRGPAGRAADFIEKNLRAPRGFSGGFFGFEPAPARIGWVSTEHNIDVFAAFSWLGRTAAAGHARDFVTAMWQPDRAAFAMGLHPDGTLNTESALDANFWPLLLPGAPGGWRGAFGTTRRLHAVGMGGVDFNTDLDGVWLEGNAYVALLARRFAEPDLAARMMRTLRDNTAADGLIYATTTPTLTTGLSTGKDVFLYYRRPHLGATAWAVLADRNISPFGETIRWTGTSTKSLFASFSSEKEDVVFPDE
jgi:hypothetical protein